MPKKNRQRNPTKVLGGLFDDPTVQAALGGVGSVGVGLLSDKFVPAQYSALVKTGANLGAGILLAKKTKYKYVGAALVGAAGASLGEWIATHFGLKEPATVPAPVPTAAITYDQPIPHTGTITYAAPLDYPEEQMAAEYGMHFLG